MGCSHPSHHTGLSAPAHHAQMSVPTFHACIFAPTHLCGLSEPTQRTCMSGASFATERSSPDKRTPRHFFPVHTRCSLTSMSALPGWHGVLFGVVTRRGDVPLTHRTRRRAVRRRCTVDCDESTFNAVCTSTRRHGTSFSCCTVATPATKGATRRARTSMSETSDWCHRAYCWRRFAATATKGRGDVWIFRAGEKFKNSPLG